jgi:hypothetical protein
MVDIPTLDGEEWWSSSAIDDTDSVVKHFTSLLRACINSGINVERSNVLLTKILANSVSSLIPLEVENWLDFCAHLSHTNLSQDASQMRNELEKFTRKHLPSKG